MDNLKRLTIVCQLKYHLSVGLTKMIAVELNLDVIYETLHALSKRMSYSHRD